MGEGTRLNKFLSERGVCSRREADRLVEAGEVSVDGRPAAVGMKVLPGQTVKCLGRSLTAGPGPAGGLPCADLPAPVLLMVNKPRGIVCTTSDRDRAENIVEFVGYPERIYPVGRLDKESEGLILMTNQGDLVNRIMRASAGHEKEYQVTVDRMVTDGFLREMCRGVPILDTVTKPCRAWKTGPRSFRLVLTQGLNRQIRRMCEHFGCRVISLKRVRIMNLQLGNLKTGAWREVTAEECRELLSLLDRQVEPSVHAPGLKAHGRQ